MSESVEPQPEALQQRSTTSDARELATLERQRSMGETVLGGNIGVFTNGDAFRLARNMAEFLAASPRMSWSPSTMRPASASARSR